MTAGPSRALLPACLASALLALLVVAPSADAHACYLVVNNSTNACDRHGPDGDMIAKGVTASPLVALALGGLLAAPLVAMPARRLLEKRHAFLSARLESAAEAYARDYLPLVLRAGLGAALLAGGLSGSFLSPLAPRAVGFLFAIAGAMLLLGLATRWAALAAAGYFLGALPGTPSLLGNLEALVMALVLSFWLPAGKPSLDDWLAEARGLPARGFEAPRVALALRFGLAAALAYGAFAEKLLDPHVMARVATEHGLAGKLGLPAESWVVLVGAGELAFATALLLGFETRATALAFALTALAMTVSLGESLAVHATLVAAALALALSGPGGFELRVRAEIVAPDGLSARAPRAP